MAIGQILGGRDAEQDTAGAGIGAYVPGDENTHENQKAMEHVFALNQQYQQEQDAAEEKEKARRIKATQDIQIDPKGIRPIDRQDILNQQDQINKYYTMSLANGKDPQDPINEKEYRNFNAMKNVLGTQVEVSSQLNKQIADETKMFQADGGKKYATTSNDNLRTAATISLPDYLASKHDRVKLGSSFLDNTDVYDPQKDAAEVLKNIAEQPLASEQDKDANGNVLRTRHYAGKDTPREIDLATGMEIPGTSNREKGANQLLAKKKFADFAQRYLHDPNNVNQYAALYQEAQARTKAGDVVTPEQIFAENYIRPGLNKKMVGKEEEDPDVAANRKIRVANSINQRKSDIKAAAGSAEENFGTSIYKTLADVGSGSPNVYTKGSDGSLYTTALQNFNMGTYNVTQENGTIKAVPNHIIQANYKEDPQGNPILFIRTDESQAKANADHTSPWIQEPDIVGNKATLLINGVYGKDFKKASAAMKALQDEAKSRGEFVPNGPYDYKKYKQSTQAVVGSKYKNESGLSDEEENLKKYQEAAKAEDEYNNRTVSKMWASKPTLPAMKIGAKKYTRQDLLKLYTEDQIEKAIKAGKITVE